MKDSSKPFRVVTIGGGTGSFVVNSGLVKDVDILSTAICTAYDNGGSTGRLRDQRGTLPMGDVRRGLLALSTANNPFLRELFAYRFPLKVGEHDIGDHSLGNLIMAAAEDLRGRREYIKDIKELLQVRGDVIPVSHDNAQLVATLSDGSVIKGESEIGLRSRSVMSMLDIVGITLEGDPQILPDARDAIIQADMIVLCPGSFYTSLIPCLITGGMREALERSQAQIVWVPNLMNHPSETHGYTPVQFAHELMKHIPRARLNAIIVNTGVIPDELLAHYAQREGEVPVASCQGYVAMQTIYPCAHSVVCEDVVSQSGFEAQLIRHDSNALAWQIRRLLTKPARTTFIVDIDDTLVSTTRDLRVDPDDLSALQIVPGAREFLQMIRVSGHRLVILSTAQSEEGIVRQREKLRAVGLIDLCTDVRIVLGYTAKEQVIEGIVDETNGSPAVIVGDAPMYELLYGARAGCDTIIRVALPVRRYEENDIGHVDYTVTDFTDPVIGKLF